MVSNSALAALCVKCGIHQLMDTRVYGAAHNLNAYVSAVTAALQEEQKTSSREGRPPGQYWLRFQPPKVSQPTRSKPECSDIICRRYQTSWKASWGLCTSQITAPFRGRKNSSTKSSNRSSTSLCPSKCSYATRPMGYWKCCAGWGVGSTQASAMSKMVCIHVKVSHFPPARPCCVEVK